MRHVLVAAVAFLFLASAALAAEISADKSRVNPGDTVVVSGSLGNGTVEFRGACVAPSRVVLHDTGRVQSNPDGTFSFSCAIPSLGELESKGVPAVQARAVIPIIVGASYNDSGEIKKVHDIVFIVNINKLNEKLSRVEERTRRASTRIDALIARADSLIQKANASGGTRAVENLERLKAHLTEFRNASSVLLAKISEVQSAGDVKSLREPLRGFEGSFRNAEKYTRLSQEELGRTPERRGGR